MKVQAGVARMLINTSSKIAQIARSRPIPFDVPCKRYEREPFFVEIRAAIWRVTCTHACNIHECKVQMYHSAKEGKWWKRKDGERTSRNKQEQRRKRELNQAESQSNFSNLSNLCRMQNQSRSTLPYRPPQEPWGPHNFQIYP